MSDGWRQTWSDLLDSLHNRSSRARQKGLSGGSAPVCEGSDTDQSGDKGDSSGPGRGGAVASALDPTDPSPDVFKAGGDHDHRIAADGKETTGSKTGSKYFPVPSGNQPTEPGRLDRRSFATIVSIVLLMGVFWVLSKSQFGSDLLAPDPPAPDVVATFDGGRITLDDIESHGELLVPSGLSEFARSPQAILSIVEDLISDQLVLRWATERRPEAEETFSHAVKHINEELSLDAFTGQLHEESLPVAESDIRSYFEANKENFDGETYVQVRDEIRQRLVIEREPEFIANYVEKLRANASITRNFELLDVPPPSNEDLERYYRANLGKFALSRRVVVDEIEVPVSVFTDSARRRASDILLRIRGGSSFEEEAARVPGVKLSLDLKVAEGTRSRDWDKKVFDLAPGVLGSVFQADDSFYVVRLIEVKHGGSQSLSEARPVVEAAVARQKEKEWFEANSKKTLFTLKGQRYPLGEFYTEYQELPSSVQERYVGPGGLRKLADALIERMLLVTDTYDKLLDVKTKPLADETRLRLLRQMMEQEEVDDKIEITESEVQQFYTENKQRMSLPPKARVRYIRIGLGSSDDETRRARERIDEAYQKVAPGIFRDGVDFEEVAMEYSEDPKSAARGGELPEWIGEKGDLFVELVEHPLHEAVLRLESGEISKPFEMSGSVYIAQVLERIEAKPLSFEEARPLMEEILTEKQHAALTADLQKRLLQEANVIMYPGVIEGYLEGKVVTSAYSEN